MRPKLTERWFDVPERARTHPVQQRLQAEILAHAARYYVVAAGRRSYKTERFLKRIFIALCLKHKNYRAFLGAPTRPQAKAIFWDDIKALVPPRVLKGRPNETELKVLFSNGSMLQIVGLKEYKRVEGVMWHAAGITEIQEVDPEFFRQTLEPIINDTRGLAVLEGRPVGRNHFYDMFNMPSTSDLWRSYHWTSEDILAPDQIAAARASLPEEDYLREYMASFDVGGQRVYYAFSDDNLKRFGFDIIRPEYPVIVTCDFNAQEKPMSWNIGQEHDGITYWYRTLSHRFTNTETMCQILDDEFKSWPSYPQRIHLYGDYSGTAHRSNSSLTDWEIIREYFRNKATVPKPFVRPCRSVRDRVATTNGRLKNMLGDVRTYIHPENCRPLIEDYDRVEWKENGVELDQDKDPRRTHCSDAVDYYNYYEHPHTGVHLKL